MTKFLNETYKCKDIFFYSIHCILFTHKKNYSIMQCLIMEILPEI